LSPASSDETQIADVADVKRHGAFGACITPG
jgi:hypothetical protein